MQQQHFAAVVEASIRVVAATAGYESAATELAQAARSGKIRYDQNLPDRAQAGLLGTIVIGPEAAASSTLSLAQTLIHELYHRHQNPFLKTLSFWSGVLTGAPVMRRYERPAYQAAHDFLEAIKSSQPQLRGEANAEQAAIRAVFATDFGAELAH